MKTLFFLFSIFITSANADCTPKDLTDPEYLRSLGKEKLIDHFKAPQNQDSVGWCGAYSSGDALSFAVGEPVSPLDISINYYANSINNKDKDLDKLRGIDILAATNMSKEFGYCPESTIPSNQTSSSNLGQAATLELLRSFQEIYDDYVTKGRPEDYCVECVQKYEKVIKPSLPDVTSDIIEGVLQKNQSDSVAAFKDLLDTLCEGKRVKVTPKVDQISKDPLKNITLVDEIDKALENDSMPSIVIHTSFFADPKAVPTGGGDHGMLITGKRQDSNGKCEYLVRNSWGKGCSFYQPQIKSKCDPATGTFWLNEGEVEAGVSHIVVIKNEKNQAIPEQATGIFTNANRATTPPKSETFFDRFKKRISSKPVLNDNQKEFIDKSRKQATQTAQIAKEKTLQTATKVKNTFSNLMKSVWKSFSDAFKY